MEVLNNAAEKIKAFNSNPKDRPRESYHCVLRARVGKNQSLMRMEVLAASILE